MNEPNPTVTLAVVVEALARIDALEQELSALIEHLSGPLAEISAITHRQLVDQARARILRQFGYDDQGWADFLREQGIDPVINPGALFE